MAKSYSVFVTRSADACAVARDGVAVAATVYSEPWTGRAGGHATHVEWTGTASGNLQLFYATKPNPSLVDDNDWFQDLNFGTAGSVALGGAPGKYGDNAENAKATLWRFKIAGGGGAGVARGWATPQAN